MVKEAASRDVSVEDSLYETVKELKGPASKGLANGTSASGPADGPPAMLNGRLSPATPDRAPLLAGVEYASVDLNKKSRYSADLEARRAAETSPRPPEPEEEKPPPIPDKVLDENENQHLPLAPGVGLQNGEISPLSPTPGLDNHQLSETELSAMYSSVVKAAAVEKEHDYSSIADIKGLLPDSASSDLYATVKDVHAPPDADGTPRPEEGAGELQDPAYETIGILKVANEASGPGQEVPGLRESDYESVGEVEFGREISRL
ncbi:hypothetical protein AAFF_G00359280 [Aldrovandia affinis]|uniref:Uncharacterized protein n=1 Tax=Aldrovandia affinis TaxID=143900 RepID=A0AAD7SJ13_9TELE|nr:hypothetical protein AAFF_G00359280 [Aldrovandia affinis]